jgi:hypothetical protein
VIGEKQREDMRDFIVKAYADGVLSEDALESCLSALEAMTDLSDLSGMVEEVNALYGKGPAQPLHPAVRRADVPASSQAREVPSAQGVPATQVVQGIGMNTKRSGRWFTSERILIELERSNVVLDFSELSSFPGICMEIFLDLKGSNVVMRFPKGAMISEDLENVGSNVHITHKGDNLYRLNVQLRGKVDGSNLRAKTKAFY